MTIHVRNEMLCAGDFTCEQLVQEFGEPIYVFDGETIVQQVSRLRSVLPPDMELLYSMKANPNISITGLLAGVVDGLEVSSLGEMYLARRAGISPKRMIFVGPAKSDKELRAALLAGMGCMVVESEPELEKLSLFAQERQVTVATALRVNPEIEGPGPKLRMGGASRQFGIDEGEIPRVLEKAMLLPNLNICGLHAYVGTRILDARAAAENTRAILKLACRLQNESGVHFDFVDVGGGLGVPYYAGETELDLELLGAELRALAQWFRSVMPSTKLLMELGRFLVAESGIYLARVRYIKSSRGSKYALLGGGMNHMMAATGAGSLIRQNFPLVIANKANWPLMETVNICGALCTPQDVLAKSAELPELATGDLVAIRNAGAYGLTASPSDFLSHPHPAEVMVWSGKAHLIRRASDVYDLARNQVFVPLAATAAGNMAQREQISD
jgi:diaminopimelate decarboxylase